MPIWLRDPARQRQSKLGTERGRATAAERGYGSKWRKARNAYLAEHPLCVMCQDEGRVTAAAVVDHIRPHRGDQALFWDRANWQPLCRPHHDRDKQAAEKGVKPRLSVDDDGWPIAP